eukprot:jgi/Astpho2/1624/Aster-x1019
MMWRALLVAILSVRAAALTGLTDFQAGKITFYGGLQDGMNPNQPSFGTLDGSCGYGLLPQTTWPFWSVGALATSSAFFENGPM